MAGKSVGKVELAAILGKTTQTLSAWQAEGMPFVKGEGKGAHNEYNTALVIEWLIRRETKDGLDLDAERAKLAKEQAESAKRKNALAAGEVLDKNVAKVVVQRAAYAIRQKIVSSSMNHADKQAVLTDIKSLRDIDFETLPAPEEEEPLPTT